mmetsp:Transcript_37874/g.81775  ORF Transcript_37874/g.81775 Transcript_37874/m.81775 type:complete len:400 (-) Transcript_37874:222-1421(-)
MAAVHVGTPPKEWESWESRLIHFHRFESISSQQGHSVESAIFSCCSHEWKVRVYPGGKKSSTDRKMAFYLAHCSGPEIRARFIFLFSDTTGKVLVKKGSSSKSLMFPEGKVKSRGCFIERAEIIDGSNEFLNNGTLTVEVRIKPDDNHCCLNFIPKNALAQNILRSFMDENTADLVFEVEGSSERRTQDQSPKSVTFYVHKLILQFGAKGSFLASLCQDCDNGTPLFISDVNPWVFRQMLYYIYGGNIAVVEWKKHAKDFIDAADRYGVKNLKIEAEAWHVKHHKISVDNVIDTLLYADEKNCFLLKEAATIFLLTNAKELHELDTFGGTPELSITREIVSLVAMMNIQGDSDNELEDPTRLSINELRAKLYDGGKDIDGPRNKLIAQLKPKKTSNPSE